MNTPVILLAGHHHHFAPIVKALLVVVAVCQTAALGVAVYACHCARGLFKAASANEANAWRGEARP